VNTCQTCGAHFRRTSADGEIRTSHCYRHQDAPEPAPDPLALVRLRRSWSPSHAVPALGIIRPALTDDDRAEAARRRDEAADPWRTSPDTDSTSAEDRLLRALNLPEPIAA
jgi:hypothetical protein